MVNKDIEKMSVEELQKLSFAFGILGSYHGNISDLLQTLFLLKTAKNLELTISGKAENGSNIMYNDKNKDSASKAVKMRVIERINDTLSKIDSKYNEILGISQEVVNG